MNHGSIHEQVEHTLILGRLSSTDRVFVPRLLLASSLSAINLLY